MHTGRIALKFAMWVEPFRSLVYHRTRDINRIHEKVDCLLFHFVASRRCPRPELTSSSRFTSDIAIGHYCHLSARGVTCAGRHRAGNFERDAVDHTIVTKGWFRRQINRKALYLDSYYALSPYLKLFGSSAGNSEKIKKAQNFQMAGAVKFFSISKFSSA